jgi:hypothetical protein
MCILLVKLSLMDMHLVNSNFEFYVSVLYLPRD